MAKEKGTAASETEKMEDVAAPSTSADQTEGVDVNCVAEAKKLMGLGHRHLVMKDMRAAVNAFQEASSLLAKKYGETADECAEAFYSYGMGLLELARVENGVLGNALEGMPEDEEGEKEEDPNIPSADNLDGMSDSNANCGDEGVESEENEDTEDKENEEDDVGSLQLAWEMLELAKVIFQRQQTKESQLKAAQAHLKLGEVSIESENYSQAVEDFVACLNIQKKHLEEHDRLLAETHYQLGLAYQYSNKHEEAISHFNQSVVVIEKRMVVLTLQMEKAAGEPALDVQKEMDELKGLLPDIKEKIEDSKEAQTEKSTELSIKETLAGGSSSGFSQENGGTSVSAIPVKKSSDGAVPATNCASDISHLVRKKRKPEEESPLKEKEAKKSKQELVANGAGSGDAVVPTNEAAEKAEEEEKHTPMETAAVESTA